jgi:Family of unknown function (DUF5752)
MTNPSTGEFRFFTERRLVALTGRRARNLAELLEHLRAVSGSCIFYHTHHLHHSHFEKPRFYNEFANWTSHALQEESLAERLGAIDMLGATSIRAIRDAIVERISKYVETTRKPARECPPGDEFHFCEAKSFVMATGVVARNNSELFNGIAAATNSSLHFHFFEARLRLERPVNDFSQWLAARGETRLARRIERVNPYSMTLDELKREIVRLGKRYRTD